MTGAEAVAAVDEAEDLDAPPSEWVLVVPEPGDVGVFADACGGVVDVVSYRDAGFGMAAGRRAVVVCGPGDESGIREAAESGICPMALEVRLWVIGDLGGEPWRLAQWCSENDVRRRLAEERPWEYADDISHRPRGHDHAEVPQADGADADATEPAIDPDGEDAAEEPGPDGPAVADPEARSRELMEADRFLVSCGFATFPLRRGPDGDPRKCKIPAVKGWPGKPMSLRSKERFWRDPPSSKEKEIVGIGIKTGEHSGNRYSKDFDDKPSYWAWVDMEPWLAAILPTVETHRGFHVYARWKGPVMSITLTDGEIKGDGTYAVAPPSEHKEGHIYRWKIRPYRDIPFVDPTRLYGVGVPKRKAKSTDVPPKASAATKPKAPRGPSAAERKTKPEPAAAKRPATSGRKATPDPGGGLTPYVRAVVDRECLRLASAAVGTRNDELNRAAFNLGRMAAWPGMDGEDVLRLLAETAVQAGLESEEIARTIESGWTRGQLFPRECPTDGATHVFLSTRRHTAAPRPSSSTSLNEDRTTLGLDTPETIARIRGLIEETVPRDGAPWIEGFRTFLRNLAGMVSPVADGPIPPEVVEPEAMGWCDRAGDVIAYQAIRSDPPTREEVRQQLQFLWQRIEEPEGATWGRVLRLAHGPDPKYGPRGTEDEQVRRLFNVLFEVHGDKDFFLSHEKVVEGMGKTSKGRPKPKGAASRAVKKLVDGGFVDCIQAGERGRGFSAATVYRRPRRTVSTEPPTIAQDAF